MRGVKLGAWIVGLLVVAAAALAALPSLVSNVCLDRRDYAPGYDTYRLVYCDEMPSYDPHGAGTTNWSGHDGGRRGETR
jgi:hypothetical protein